MRHLLIALFLVCPAIAQAASFDGRWSVLVVTEKGDCDKAYRYEVAVGQGKVKYAGDAAVGLDGTVTSSGSVSVAIGKGGEHASGTGRLSATAGSGTWRGAGANGSCAGTWQAERR